MIRTGISKLDFAMSSPSSSRSPSSRRSSVRFPTTRCVAAATTRMYVNDYYSVLGLSPFASKSDVKHAYKRLALKHHPDVVRSETVAEKIGTFQEIKLAYENLMQKFEEEEEMRIMKDYEEEWEEWMGFEGGIPATL